MEEPSQRIRDHCLKAVAHLKVSAPAEEPSLQVPERDLPVVRALAHGLLVVYLIDEGSHFSYVQQRQLAAAGLTEDELHVAAIENLRLFANANARVIPYGAMYAVLAGGNFESSLLLLPGFWSTYQYLAPNGFAVAFPARDLLAFGDVNSAAALAELRALCARSEGKVDHPSSGRLYQGDGDEWRPLGD